MNTDKTEYLKALTAEREALCAKLLDLESRLDEIDAEISRNDEPPDVSKMSPIQRAAYEDGLRLSQKVAQTMAECAPFMKLLEGDTFPIAAGRVCKK